MVVVPLNKAHESPGLCVDKLASLRSLIYSVLLSISRVVSPPCGAEELSVASRRCPTTNDFHHVVWNVTMAPNKTTGEAGGGSYTGVGSKNPKGWG